MEQLTFDERNIMKSVFNGKLEAIAQAAKVSVPTVRNGWTCYSESLLTELRDRLVLVRQANATMEDAKKKAWKTPFSSRTKTALPFRRWLFSLPVHLLCTYLFGVNGGIMEWGWGRDVACLVSTLPH